MGRGSFQERAQRDLKQGGIQEPGIQENCNQCDKAGAGGVTD